MNVIKGLKLWQVGALAAVFIAIGASACGGAALTRDSVHQGLGEDWQLVAVRSGNLTKEVPVKGRLVFPHTAELTFGVAGEVGEILAQPGQQVTQGQVLARLDAVTRAELSKVVAGERVDLDRAQERLEDFQRSHSQQLAKARQARARADVGLAQALEALDDFQQDYNQRLARSVQARAEAEVVLDQAQETLEDFHQDHQRELAKARQARADAEAALDRAQKQLGSFHRDYQQKLARARQARAEAEMALDTVQDQLDDFQMDYAQRLAEARQARADAEVALREAEDARAAFIVNPTRDLREPDEIFDVRALQRLQVAVELARANLEKAQDGVARLEGGQKLLERQELEAAVELARADRSVAEKALADIVNQPTQEDIALREAKVAAARAELRAEEEALNALMSGGPTPSTGSPFDSAQGERVEPLSPSAPLRVDSVEGADPLEVAGQETSVNAARAALTVAEDNLAAIRAGANPLELQQLEATVAEARTDLARKLDDLNRLERGPDRLKLQQLQAGVDLAHTTLAGAEKDLSKLSEGPDPLRLALLEREVSLVRETVAEAEKDLVDLSAGPDSLELALLEAEVSLAQSALDRAAQNLDGATIRAPFDGVVFLVNAEVDDTVSKTSRIVEIVDPAVVEVVGSVDASHVQSVEVGDRARVNIDRLPDQVLDGTVSRVAAQPRTEGGVVSYPVTIRVSLPEGLEIPVGLSAVSGTVILEDETALLVPRSAVRGSSGQPAVLVMNNSTVEERAVVLGESDGNWVEVIDGLDRGEQVIVDGASVPAFRSGTR